jgi:hypothetical protein
MWLLHYLRDGLRVDGCEPRGNRFVDRRYPHPAICSLGSRPLEDSQKESACSSTMKARLARAVPEFELKYLSLLLQKQLRDDYPSVEGADPSTMELGRTAYDLDQFSRFTSSRQLLFGRSGRALLALSDRPRRCCPARLSPARIPFRLAGRSPVDPRRGLRTSTFGRSKARDRFLRDSRAPRTLAFSRRPSGKRHGPGM